MELTLQYEPTKCAAERKLKLAHSGCDQLLEPTDEVGPQESALPEFILGMIFPPLIISTFTYNTFYMS